MQYSTLYDRLVVKRIEAKTQTAGGLILPTQSQEKPQEAVVVGIGCGHRNIDGTVTPLRVKEGDVVIFGKFAGDEIRIGDESFLIIKEQDILAFGRQ